MYIRMNLCSTNRCPKPISNTQDNSAGAFGFSFFSNDVCQDSLVLQNAFWHKVITNSCRQCSHAGNMLH
jgi:hypothetical protein